MQQILEDLVIDETNELFKTIKEIEQHIVAYVDLILVRIISIYFQLF